MIDHEPATPAELELLQLEKLSEGEFKRLKDESMGQ